MTPQSDFSRHWIPDRLQDDEPGAGGGLPAVVAHQPRVTISGAIPFAGSLSIAMIGTTIRLRKDVSIANHDVFDFLERTGIHAHAARRNGVPPSQNLPSIRSAGRLRRQNFSGHQLNWCARRHGGKMAIFAVNGKEYLGLPAAEQAFVLPDWRGRKHE